MGVKAPRALTVCVRAKSLMPLSPNGRAAGVAGLYLPCPTNQHMFFVRPERRSGDAYMLVRGLPGFPGVPLGFPLVSFGNGTCYRNVSFRPAADFRGCLHLCRFRWEKQRVNMLLRMQGRECTQSAVMLADLGGACRPRQRKSNRFAPWWGGYGC